MEETAAEFGARNVRKCLLQLAEKHLYGYD